MSTSLYPHRDSPKVSRIFRNSNTTISPYPRRGQPLAPRMLRNLLHTAIPLSCRAGILHDKTHLHQLDASIWKCQTASGYCELLSQQVLQALTRNAARLEKLADERLPMPPSGTSLNDLALETRTYNCLRNYWPECERNLQELGYKTIGDVMNLAGFGLRSLVDLLTSLEALQDSKKVMSSSGDTILELRHIAHHYVAELCERYPSLHRKLQASLAYQLSQLENASDKDKWARGARAAFNAKVETVLDIVTLTDLPVWGAASGECQNSSSQEQPGSVNETGQTTPKENESKWTEAESKPDTPEESLHDERLGLLLEDVDNTAGELCEGIHRVAWLLHAGYDAKAGAIELEKIWNGLDNVMQSVSHLETLVSQTEPGRTLTPLLDQELSQLAQNIADYPSLSEIQRDDVRLFSLLYSLMDEDETLQDVIENLLVRQRDPVDKEEIKQRLKKLWAQMLELSQLTIEDEVKGVFEELSSRWRNSQRSMEVLGWRYGLDGGGGHTLEEIGAHFKVTRERIRQIIRPAEDALKERSAWTPALSRALQWLEGETPLALSEIGAKLKQEGLASSELSWGTIDRIATLLQRDVPFEVATVGTTSFLQSISGQEDSDLAAQIIGQARRRISRWGVATLEDIAVRVGEKRAVKAQSMSEEAIAETSIEPALVERILRTQSDFVRLDTSDWFWLSSVPRNGLISQIEKVLAAAPRVGITDLRVGVSREQRRQGFIPPKRVLLELCRQLPGLGVEGDEVFIRDPQSVDITLSITEQTLVDILREHGPIMTRVKLERHCTAAGMPRGTFYHYLMHSPIIEKYERSIYGLRGSHVEPGFIESLETEWTVRRTRVLQDYGWDADGKAWLSYTLSEGVLGNGVCSVPSALQRSLQGSYSLWTTDGSYAGNWSCKGPQAWGVSPFLRRFGGEPGDILLLVVDISARKVVAELGDETLIEQYNEGADVM